MAGNKANTHKEFYESRNPDLASYFNLSKDKITAEELAFSHPIQHDFDNSPDRYTDQELIDKGGMKSVYRVKDNNTGCYVAMAILEEEQNKDLTERFLREARLTSSLEHPNIITVHDIGINEYCFPFFTMELLHGETLADIIENLEDKNKTYKSKYKEYNLLTILLKICDAMSFAHSRNILHLDIKPEHIHIGKYGEVIVCDWGIAKIMGEEDFFEANPEDNYLDPNIINDMTQSGLVKGTPGFMAPEQCMEEGEKNTLTDIYSLGALLYSMLTYCAPTIDSDHKKRIHDTLHGNIPPVASRNPSQKISPRLEAIAMKALSLYPEDRYQSVDSLSTDINKYMHGYATMAEKNNFLTQFVLLVNRNKTVFSLISIFLAVVLSLLAVSFIKINESKNNALVAKEEAIDAKVATQNINMGLERTLKLLKEETALTQKLNSEIEEVLVQNASENDLANPKNNIRILALGIQKEIEPEKKMILWKKKGMLHFVLQEFTEAKKSFENANMKDHEFYPLTVKYAEIKKNDEILSEAQLSELIAELKHRNKDIISRLYANHIERKGIKNINSDEYIPLAKKMLPLANNYPLWYSPKFADLKKEKNGRYSLNLSDSPYHTLKISLEKDYNIFTPIKFEYLNVSKSSFPSLDNLSGLTIRKLNITGTLIQIDTERIRQLLKRMGVKELILDTQDRRYKKEHLEEVKEFCKITDYRDVK